MVNQDLIEELSNWLSLQKSGELKSLFNIFKSHKERCISECLLAVKQKDHDKAMIEEAKARDMEKISSLILERIEYLKKGGLNG